LAESQQELDQSIGNHLIVPRYFLLSVSTRENLDLCRKYALAGTTNSASGAWAFVEIKVGDYVSLLYGAKAYDLYRVERKYALRGAENVGPWPMITFKESGLSYYFPFRLELHPVRKFEESLVRAEFAYVAENLLLRGGYRKTHFQADQTTLQLASEMGDIASPRGDEFNHRAESFEPAFVQKKSESHPPESYHFNEFILQSLLKDFLSSEGALDRLTEAVPELKGKSLEILGEKALQRGLVDILVKEATPIGRSNKVVIEVKNRIATFRDLTQLSDYRAELGSECVATLLAARKFSDELSKKARELVMGLITCDMDWRGSNALSYAELERGLRVSFTGV